MKLQRCFVVSMIVLFAASPGVFGGPTSVVGSVATFTGDQSSGIFPGGGWTCPPIYTLHVNSLTTDIAPAPSFSGIKIIRSGGNGGNGASLGSSSADEKAGDGGAGHHGGEATGMTWLSPAVSFTGSGYEIITSGASALGVGAVSAGGTGGNGGNRVGFWEIFVANAGHGGAGGWGFPVTVDSDGGIHTDGSSSYGILARSQGGDGGDGGHARTTLASATAGNGGAGGHAGGGTVTGSGSIYTNGAASPGIQVLSQGGNGGDGGDARANSIAMAGAGGAGGMSLAATVTNYAGIHTNGSASPGIYALSDGGDGGDGGDALAIGGSAGNGGPGAGGGAVTVSSNGNIETAGNSADGIIAASLGGAGGSGGSASGAFGNSGLALGTGPGGAVEVTNEGDILTSGTDARGIFAQSVGGFAGDVGGATGLVGLAGWGGSSDSGGDGGTVKVTNHGVVTTTGDSSERIGGAIVAKSIGGGGGDAGLIQGMIAIGGTGSAGGDGGDVTVTNWGPLQTSGNNSSGILAESIGGGGGDGASSKGIGVEFTVTLGGSGESGGDGKKVKVASEDTSITTAGDLSHGIRAMSIGGGGGNGGSVVSYTVGVDFTANLALGGQGGDGGDGGIIELTSHSQITTQGEHAHGLYGQSVGGGGGSGGNAVALTANLGLGVTEVPTITAGVALGATGGDGGSGSKVTVASTEDISTSGFRSYGLLAQSLGGGGGDGGNSMAGTLAFSTDVVVNVAMGGGGGTAGNGGEIDVDSDGMIETDGDFAHGTLAQSIGGGGGAGGNSSLLMAAIDIPTGVSLEDLLPRSVTANVALGGAGAAGGAGGRVDVDNTGDIRTKGKFANGILAQSIGGGGGAGGDSMEISLTASVNLLPGVGVEVEGSVGGFAYMGGDPDAIFAPNKGGSVIVHNSGAIITEGAFANGIVAQSIGGGGGAGGDSTKISADFGLNPIETFLPSTTYSASGSVGGFGGQGGGGDSVAVDNSGDITTTGHFANGILAQSVGGGGGAGGNSMEVAIDLGPDPTESLLAFMNPEFELSVGGFAGSGGAGGVVTVDNSGNITTAGHFANGILAQSIGGGGGVGGDLTEIDVTWTGGSPPLWDSAGSDRTLSLGGHGGMGGGGGVVAVDNHGDIITSGDFANGILAQSIGGGGGTGGSVTTRSLALTGEESPSTSLDGASAGIGNGGQVTVENDGQIVTHGGFAHGILAQSIGGGGGFGGIDGNGGTGTLNFGGGAIGVFIQSMAFGSGFAGSTGGSGSAGAVSVTHTGSITTYGDMSHGILAQSAAGHDGAAGPVTVTLASSITAHGVNSDGIHAQSLGGSGNGNISISLGGIVRGGSGAGVGVNLDGGADNILTNRGDISALSGTAILASTGNDLIENYGTISGSLGLGLGNNGFNNDLTARLNAGAFVDLGEGNLFTNGGIFSPGGSGTILHTVLTGDFFQLDSGILEIDIGGFEAGSFDSIEVTGLFSAGAEPAMGFGLLALSVPTVNVHFSFLPEFDLASALAAQQSLTFGFLSAGSMGDLSMSYTFSGCPAGYQFDVLEDDGALYLVATNTIPAPGALLLTSLGLGLLGWRRRGVSS